MNGFGVNMANEDTDVLSLSFWIYKNRFNINVTYKFTDGSYLWKRGLNEYFICTKVNLS